MRLVPECSDGQSESSRNRRQEEDLRGLASQVGIPFQVVDLTEEFENQVIAPFLASYLEGLTPNPCAVCNPRVKFRALLKEAQRLGAGLLATGHYAQVVPPERLNGRWGLRKARDRRKDQSYFLYGLTQDQLAVAAFPLGGTLKEEVLHWASGAGLERRIPRESQEICFIRTGTYLDFVRRRVDLSPYADRGPILDLEGKVLGEHKGIFAYTIGQRRGLGIASGAPYYVVDLDPASGTVTVGRAPDLYRRELTVSHVNWVSMECPDHPILCQVRIRNQHRPADALLSPLGRTEVKIRFREPQRAVTPGQAAVFYDGDLVLGGGTIRRLVHSSD